MVKNSQDTNKAGNVAIVIGATSRIACSLIERLANNASFTKIVAISRQFSDKAEISFGHKVSCFQSDYSEESISKICEQLRSHKGNISHRT